MKEKKFILSFAGNKVELHKKLKSYCVEAEETMNGHILELIEKDMKKRLPLRRV